ncbi:MAG: tRNA 2-selenouridine(34) synthase MnmH [Pararhodobacter sp.]
MRPVSLTSLAQLDTLGFDEVIDVRAPAEYADDHIPGAINLPVLDDDERARVGTVYTRESRFLARRLGAALVARNAAHHLEGYLSNKSARYRPLLYCWRGGQRSGSLALILGQIGWQVGLLQGGWRSYRRLVAQALYEAPFPAPLRVLDGNTGTAKTALLARIATLGGQVIDLEALANHRGSIFGLEHGQSQPTQKRFESALALAIARLDPSRPVLVEAESIRIGALRLPPSLWQAMQSAPRLVIEAPLRARAHWLTATYTDLMADPHILHTRLEALAPFHPRACLAEWRAMVDEGAHAALAEALMVAHYDPRYRRSRRQSEPPAALLHTQTLDPAALDALAASILTQLGSL